MLGDTAGLRLGSRRRHARREEAPPGRFPKESTVSSSPSRQVLTPGTAGQARSARPVRSRRGSLRPRCSPRCRCRRSARAVESSAGPRGTSRPRRSARPPIGCYRDLICMAAPRPWRGVTHRRRGADGGATHRRSLPPPPLPLLRPRGAALGLHRLVAGGKPAPRVLGSVGGLRLPVALSPSPWTPLPFLALASPLGSGGFPTPAAGWEGIETRGGQDGKTEGAYEPKERAQGGCRRERGRGTPPHPPVPTHPRRVRQRRLPCPAALRRAR